MPTSLDNTSAPVTQNSERDVAQLATDSSMDVIIKSFNRPYYLDRCLCSIREHVRGARSVQVLDDGTPDKYLQEIKRRHPGITILRSARHAEKAAYLESYASRAGAPPKAFSAIPWDLWRSAVQTASRYFLLMEDDQWCVKRTDMQAIGTTMESHTCAIVRLFRCPAFDRGVVSQISPELFTITPWYLRKLGGAHFLRSYLLNQCKMASVLRRLGIARNQWALDAYTLYVVCSIFERDYWLDVTKGAGNGVNERMQLANAVGWAARHPQATFARTDENHLATTFRSSSSSADLDGDVGFDMLLFNKLINEQWLAGGLDACAGVPGDFPAELILSILEKAGDARCAPEKWSLWCNQFSESFRNIGCDIG